jgi:hypothetical protein
MNERLEALIHLQEIDDAIERTNEQLRSLPIRAQATERELARSRDALEELRRDLTDVQKEADHRELQLRTGEANLTRLQAQRLAVETNREYAVLSTQIGGMQADNARLEDQVLALYAKLDRAQKAHQAHAAEVQRLSEELQAILDQSREEAAGLEGRLAELEGQSDQARQGVPPEALRLYQKLRRRLGASPVAAVRDEVCTGCNMSVSPQTVSTLRLGRDLIQCTSCTRILFLDGDGP